MFEEQHLTEIYTLLARIAKAIVATVGPQCEVVVHDLRTPENSVVAISGQLTGRKVGAPAPDPEMLPTNLQGVQSDILREQTITPFGRQLISSTVWVRNTRGHIVGAICINMDFSDLRRARDLLDQALLNASGPLDPSPTNGRIETYATTPEEFVTIALHGAINKIGKPVHHLNRQDKIAVLQDLYQAEVFRFHHAVEIVMQELGISRASIYAYLKDIRQELAAKTSDA
ncbi:transcriptional regulator [Ktedonosporobacter rubrisoli]|uniref:Transcriptional regulator n=1 Tax=Ktedonosporobacter rubrisoli TaxID=2509675 RepID=A0A4P6JTI2_KTERU|nr:helix-turn-helix transcriptional regulator [Ktedonosporobacter rubrisoli]QBD78623.1 transcriptional regulator [Ktedonosporobacter rubrisoli]